MMTSDAGVAQLVTIVAPKRVLVLIKDITVINPFIF